MKNRPLSVLFITGLLIIAAILALTCGPARADDKTDAQAQDIFNSVMSPFCPGRLLNDCPSSSAAELKEKIRTELRSGMTEDQVLNEIYGTFGSGLRAAPEAKGFGAFAWWTPVAFLLAGGLIIGFWVKRSQSASSADEAKKDPAAAPVSSEMQARIEAELKRFES